MNEQTRIEIRQALEQLDRATDIKGVAVLALVMPHGTRGRMDVQILTRGASEQYVAHKLYECMRSTEQLPLDAVLQEIFQTRDRSMEQNKIVAI